MKRAYTCKPYSLDLVNFSLCKILVKNRRQVGGVKQGFMCGCKIHHVEQFLCIVSFVVYFKEGANLLLQVYPSILVY